MIVKKRFQTLLRAAKNVLRCKKTGKTPVWHISRKSPKMLGGFYPGLRYPVV